MTARHMHFLPAVAEHMVVTGWQNCLLGHPSILLLWLSFAKPNRPHIVYFMPLLSDFSLRPLVPQSTQKMLPASCTPPRHSGHQILSPKHKQTAFKGGNGFTFAVPFLSFPTTQAPCQRQRGLGSGLHVGMFKTWRITGTCRTVQGQAGSLCNFRPQTSGT